ncbi:hypothetical protein UM89_17640 [Bacillus subtilis]|nr:hypothetical protein UM89_17640 [Bacillus subtilis]
MRIILQKADLSKKKTASSHRYLESIIMIITNFTESPLVYLTHIYKGLFSFSIKQKRKIDQLQFKRESNRMMSKSKSRRFVTDKAGKT